MDLFWRLSGDLRRAAVVFAFFALFLAAVVTAIAFVAPYMAAIVGVLGGLGLFGGGTAVVRNYRQRRSDTEEDQE